MKEYMEQRAVKLAEYIIETGDTVRGASKVFAVSKSTIHKDITERLKEVDTALAKEVKTVLEKNKSERHIRGGNATREKYKQCEK